jgi:endoglucanase
MSAPSPVLPSRVSFAAIFALALGGGCGREAVPAHAEAPNRVSNGDFSSGIAPWGAHVAGSASAEPPLEPRLEAGVLCTTVKGGQEIIVGWPVSGSAESFALEAGVKYELSLRASVSGTLPVACVIKVGHQVAPFTTAFATSLPLGPALERFSTAFTPDHPDDRAGIAVECRGAPGSSVADVCIDDVSLMP